MARLVILNACVSKLLFTVFLFAIILFLRLTNIDGERTTSVDGRSSAPVLHWPQQILILQYLHCLLSLYWNHSEGDEVGEGEEGSYMNFFDGIFSKIILFISMFPRNYFLLLLFGEFVFNRITRKV